MKTNRFTIRQTQAAGFTLIELLVAMSVTIVLLGVLVYLTGLSMDTYRDSRDKVRAARQAQVALDQIGSDFEAMVARRDGNSFQWLYAAVDPELTDGTALAGPAGKEIANASQLIFFTGAPDRYDGQIGVAGTDNGGDVSAVGYRLVYRDQISGAAAAEVGAYPVFTLYRHIVDPDVTFINVLGQEDLTNPAAPAVNQFTNPNDYVAENVLVENIYELTVTFLVQYLDDNGTPANAADDVTKVERATIGQTAGDQYATFTMMGNGIVATGGNNAAAIADGQLVGVEISITVLSDRGVVMTQKSGMSRGEIIAEHGHHYTKRINVPRP